MKSASAKAVARLICRSRSQSPSSSKPSAAFSGSARVCQTLVAAAEGEGVAPASEHGGAPSDILAVPGNERHVKEGLWWPSFHGCCGQCWSLLPNPRWQRTSHTSNIRHHQKAGSEALYSP